MEEILKKYSKYQIAEKCGVSYVTVIKWCKTKNIPLRQIQKLGFEICCSEEKMYKDALDHQLDVLKDENISEGVKESVLKVVYNLRNLIDKKLEV